MSLIQRLLGQEEPEPQATTRVNKPERIQGKIIKLGRGWGFITSRDIEYTRIFFHWSALQQDTLHFTELRKGMKVEFEPLEHHDKGIRAIRIRVLED